MLLFFLKDYEDDFEDIDDEDYEEDEDSQQQDREEKEVEGPQLRKGPPIAKNSEVEEIQKAINAENEKIKNFFPKQRAKEILSKNYEKEQKVGMWMGISLF